MSPCYEVVFIHSELEDFAREVEDTVRYATRQVLLQPDLLSFKYDMSDVGPDSQVVVVYLGSTAGRNDVTVIAALAARGKRPLAEPVGSASLTMSN